MTGEQFLISMRQEELARELWEAVRLRRKAIYMPYSVPDWMIPEIAIERGIDPGNAIEIAARYLRVE